MFEFIFFYLLCGFFTNVAQKLYEAAPSPVERDTIGIMLIWPVFVVKWLGYAVVWFVMNFFGSVAEATRKAFSR